MMALTHEQVLDEFRDAGALLEGHFVLSSGLHSPRYLQCARVLMDPARAARLCKALAEKVRGGGHGMIDLVASPAMGGVVVGYEMARQLGVSSRECIDGIASEGGVTVAAACLINRSGGKAEVGVPLHALTSLDVPTYAADALPPELAAIPAYKPGSRGLKK